MVAAASLVYHVALRRSASRPSTLNLDGLRSLSLNPRCLRTSPQSCVDGQVTLTPAQLQGGKLDDITLVMAMVDEEETRVVRAPLQEAEDSAGEALMSDSEAVPPGRSRRLSDAP